MGSPFGFHWLVDAMDTNDISDAISKYIVPAQPNWINITGASRFNLALSFVEQVRAAAPQVNIILRQSGFSSNGLSFSDNGVWKTMTPQNWIDLWVRPILPWLQKWKPIYMVDNESIESGQLLEDYANWMASAIQLCNPLGVLLGVGRFPSGTPDFGQYIHLLPMFKALAKYGGIWTPNEYFGQTDELSNSLVGRFIEGLNVCDQNGVAKPTVVIGEYSVAYATKVVVNGQTQIKLDPQRGFRHPSVGWNEQQLMDKCASNFNNWIGPRGAQGVCIFAEGPQPPYETFDCGKGFYSIAITAAGTAYHVPNSTPTSPPPTTPPTTTPSPVVAPVNSIPLDDPRWVSVVVKPTPGNTVNIRQMPSTTGNKPIASLVSQTAAFLAVDDSWGSWAQIRFDNVWGWISKTYIIWNPVETLMTITIPAAMFDRVVAALRTSATQTEQLADVLEQFK